MPRPDPQGRGDPAPLARDQADRRGSKIRVSLDRPCRFTVEVGGDEASPSQIEGQVRSLYVFANPVETDKPDPDAPNIIYFGPGLHRPGTIEVKTGQTVYLAGGAVVHARIIGWEANDVTICGRGILHLGHVPVPTVIVPGQVFPAMLALTRCHGLRMEGITLLDAAVWTVVLKECSNVRISNIKIVNGRYYSTDGINPVNCQDVAIEDCFFRCTDDNISVKGLNWDLPSRNILVERCTFWSDNNNAVVVGPESKCTLLENVTFRNCDILYVHDNQEIKAAMSVIQLDDTSMTNITFEDIRVERAGPAGEHLLHPRALQHPRRVQGRRHDSWRHISEHLRPGLAVPALRDQGPRREARGGGCDLHEPPHPGPAHPRRRGRGPPAAPRPERAVRPVTLDLPFSDSV